MKTTFEHPLARDAKIWQTAGLKGKPTRVLVIITTLELDEEQKTFKKTKVDALSSAAREWILENQPVAADYMLMNRPKDWHGDHEN